MSCLLRAIFFLRSTQRKAQASIVYKTLFKCYAEWVAKVLHIVHQDLFPHGSLQVNSKMAKIAPAHKSGYGNYHKIVGQYCAQCFEHVILFYSVLGEKSHSQGVPPWIE